MTADLVAWLRQQLDHDEQVARAAMAGEGDDGAWAIDTDWPESGRRIEGKGITIYDEGGHDEHQAEHIALHDPAHELRTVAAHRAILGWCSEVIGDRDPSRYGEHGALADDRQAMAVTLAVETLRTLASIYVERPGFDPAWKVDG